MNECSPSRWAVIDMGSNGIRFSITELGTQARILPLLFQERLAISLYDVQHKAQPCTVKIPIPEETIREIINSIHRFLTICKDFQVTDYGAVATEATRQAMNSQSFLEEIYNATKIQFELLSKEEEARLGAEGIASSMFTVSGIAVDLGGGSVQINRISSEFGVVTTSGIPMSLPYGAAALSLALSSSPDTEAARRDLSAQVFSSFKTALFGDHASEDTFSSTQPNIETDLYLTGGGMRGFGHIHRSEYLSDSPHRFPMINGYCTTPDALLHTVDKVLTQKKAKGLSKIPGVSKRRVLQLPAITLVLQSLFAVLPPIRRVYFCQGGIREGFLFARLPIGIKTMDPLIVATEIYKPRDASKILCLLKKSIPDSTFVPPCPILVRNRITAALVNMSTLFSTYPKETCAAAASQSPITGCLSNSHGLTHEERLLLAVALSWRYGDDNLSFDLQQETQKVVNCSVSLDWCGYIGRVCKAILTIFPSGVVEDNLLAFRSIDTQNSSFTLVASLKNNPMMTSSSVGTKAFQEIVSKHSSSVSFHVKLENRL